MLSHKIREQYRSKINKYISDYRESDYEDDDGYTHKYDVLEDAYDDCYDTVDSLFEDAMTAAFYYGLRLGLEKSKNMKNE
jgi:hypothetical protein